eukprot:Colp12_sorted_trinity150504_noHs@33565
MLSMLRLLLRLLRRAILLVALSMCSPVNPMATLRTSSPFFRTAPTPSSPPTSVAPQKRPSTTLVASKLIAFINKGPTLGAVNFPEITLPPLEEGKFRILNIHTNTPGVMRDINTVISQYNISAQTLSTKGGVGYLAVDIDSAMGDEAKKQIQSLSSNIRTRILY